MKYLFFVLGAFLLDSVAAQPFFCGSEPCLVPLEISCEKLQQEYTFQGSCCSLETIEDTKGCRVKVQAGGNCIWIYNCGECDPVNKCGIEYSTVNTDACPASNFTVLGVPSPSPSIAPPVLGAGETAAPSVTTMPSFFPTPMPTCPLPPTNEPVSNPAPIDTDGAAAAWGMMTVVSSLVLSTIYTML
jgi:hypothetical protein